MYCLDHESAAADHEQMQKAVARVKRSGGAFVWSARFGEWLIVVDGMERKQKLHGLYGCGIAVYTLDEVQRLRQMTAEDQLAVYLIVRDMQASVEEVSA